MTARGKRLPDWLPPAAIALLFAVLIIYLILAILGK
jgi:hypothetical protein